MQPKLRTTLTCVRSLVCQVTGLLAMLVMSQILFEFQSSGVAFGKGIFYLKSIASLAAVIFLLTRNITQNIKAIDCRQKIYLPITDGKNKRCPLV